MVWQLSAIYKHRQIYDLALKKMQKLNTKYVVLAQSNLESKVLSTALLTIY